LDRNPVALDRISVTAVRISVAPVLTYAFPPWNSTPAVRKSVLRVWTSVSRVRKSCRRIRRSERMLWRGIIPRLLFASWVWIGYRRLLDPVLRHVSSTERLCLAGVPLAIRPMRVLRDEPLWPHAPGTRLLRLTKLRVHLMPRSAVCQGVSLRVTGVSSRRDAKLQRSGCANLLQ